MIEILKLLKIKPSHFNAGWANFDELAYRVPASKITKKNMSDFTQEVIKGLDTTIDWKNTEDNSYDGEKLKLLVHDESGKWIKPNNIKENWRLPNPLTIWAKNANRLLALRLRLALHSGQRRHLAAKYSHLG